MSDFEKLLDDAVRDAVFAAAAATSGRGDFDRLASQAAASQAAASQDALIAAINALKANAAAATDMLSALQAILATLEESSDVRDGPDGEQIPNDAMHYLALHGDQMRAAIARATGEQPVYRGGA